MMLGSFVKKAPPDIFARLSEKLVPVTATKVQEASDFVQSCG